MALMVSVTFAQVLITRSPLSNAAILAEIIAIGLSLAATQTIAFPDLIGVDPWWHRWFVTEIIALGHLPPNTPYSAFPIFHLEVASAALGTGLGYKLSTLSSITLLLCILDSIVVYLIGRLAFNDKVGLVAALLLSVGSFNVQTSYWTIPNSLGAPLVLLSVYLLLKRSASGVLMVKGSAIVFLAILVLTHPIASAIMVMTLFLGVMAFLPLARITRNVGLPRPISATVATMFGVSMLGWWTYASGYTFSAIADLVHWGFSIDAFIKGPPEALAYANSVPLSEQLLSLLGPMLFFSVSMIGGLSMVSKTLGSRTRGFLAIVGGTTVAFPFFSLLTGHSIIEGRWWFMAMVFLSIPLALTFVFATQLNHKRNVSTFFATCAIGSIAFLLITSPIANIDNVTFYHNTSVRTALTEGEIDSAIAAHELFHRTIATDEYFSTRIPFLGVNSSSLSSQLYSGKFHEGSELYLIRSEVVSNPFFIFSSTPWKLTYNPVVLLDTDDGFSRVFDSGATVGYLSLG
jgi:hypothetical protein